MVFSTDIGVFKFGIFADNGEICFLYHEIPWKKNVAGSMNCSFSFNVTGATECSRMSSLMSNDLKN